MNKNEPVKKVSPDNQICSVSCVGGRIGVHEGVPALKRKFFDPSGDTLTQGTCSCFMLTIH